MSYLGETTNDYGTPESRFLCPVCGSDFTICPAVSSEKMHLWENEGCGDAECDSYDPGRDVDRLFGDNTMFLRWCERKGIDPASVSRAPSGEIKAHPNTAPDRRHG